MRRLDGKPHGSPKDLDWLMSWVSPEPNSGCWLWTGTLNPGGYGTLTYGGFRGAHKIAWLLAGRTVPSGHDLDHLCRVRCCVNPDHLEPVTRSVNLKRGIGPAILSARQASRTHCPKGHPYEGSNLYVSPRGDRNCIICQRARVREWKKRQRQNEGEK